MKTILILLGTFALAFATSLLLDWPVVQQHWIRQVIIILFIIVEFILGYMVFVDAVAARKKEK